MLICGTIYRDCEAGGQSGFAKQNGHSGGNRTAVNLQSSNRIREHRLFNGEGDFVSPLRSIGRSVIEMAGQVKNNQGVATLGGDLWQR